MKLFHTLSTSLNGSGLRNGRIGQFMVFYIENSQIWSFRCYPAETKTSKNQIRTETEQSLNHKLVLMEHLELQQYARIELEESTGRHYSSKYSFIINNISYLTNKINSTLVRASICIVLHKCTAIDSLLIYGFKLVFR